MHHFDTPSLFYTSYNGIRAAITGGDNVATAHLSDDKSLPSI